MNLKDKTIKVVQLVVMGHLLDDLPDGGANFCGKDIPIGEETTVLSLAHEIGLGEQAEFFVMINDEHLPNKLWDSRFLRDGEQLVLCPPLKGG